MLPKYMTISDTLGVSKPTTKTSSKTSSQTSTPEPTFTPSTVVPVSDVSTPIQKTPTFEPPKLQSNVQQSIDSILAQAGDIQGALDKMKTPAVSQRDQYLQNYLNEAQTSQVDEKQQIREDAMLAEKEKTARDRFNRITERDNYYRDRIEALEQNPEGKLRGALNAEINDLERKRSREMADLSFAYNIALGDYNSASKVVDERIADMEADRKARMDMWKTAYDFAMDDMSESEKLQAQQAFQKQMDEENFKQQKEISLFNDQLARQRDSINASRIASQSQSSSGISELGIALANDPSLFHELTPTDKGKAIVELTAMGIKIPRKLGAEQQKAANIADSGLLALQEMDDFIIQDNGDYDVSMIQSFNPFGQYANLRRSVIDAVSRLQSGAALTDDEVDFYTSQTPGAFDSSEVIKQKQAHLALLFSGISGNAVVLQSPDGQMLSYDNMFQPLVRKEVRDAIDEGYQLVDF